MEANCEGIKVENILKYAIEYIIYSYVCKNINAVYMELFCAYRILILVYLGNKLSEEKFA